MAENQERGGAFVWLLWVESEIGGLLERKSEKRVHLFLGRSFKGVRGSWRLVTEEESNRR